MFFGALIKANKSFVSVHALSPQLWERRTFETAFFSRKMTIFNRKKTNDKNGSILIFLFIIKDKHPKITNT